MVPAFFPASQASQFRDHGHAPLTWLASHTPPGCGGWCSLVLGAPLCLPRGHLLGRGDPSVTPRAVQAEAPRHRAHRMSRWPLQGGGNVSLLLSGKLVSSRNGTFQEGWRWLCCRLLGHAEAAVATTVSEVTVHAVRPVGGHCSFTDITRSGVAMVQADKHHLAETFCPSGCEHLFHRGQPGVCFKCECGPPQYDGG